MSAYFWWCTFIFPLPLFFFAKKNRISFMYGYFWGLVAYGLPLSAIFVALFDMSIGPLYIRMFPLLVLFLYIPLFAAISFYSTHIIFKHYLYASAAGLLLVIYLVDQYAFFIFGRLEGCILMNPLLVLAQQPSLLWLLPYVGIGITTGIWLSISFFIMKSLQNNRYILGVLFGLLFFISGFFVEKKEPIVYWKDTIVAVPKLFGATNNQDALFERLQLILKAVIDRYPQVQIIIFPEGAFYCKDLATSNAFSKKIASAQLGKKVHLIIGAFHEENEVLYNSLQWFYDGIFYAMHHKSHVLPITEQLPWWLSCSWYKNAYFSSITEIVQADSANDIFSCDLFSFIPRICSEFYCKKDIVFNPNQIPLLVVCNDSWFMFPKIYPYIQTLMRLGAQFRAIEQQNEVVFISFSSAFYISKNGIITPLCRFFT